MALYQVDAPYATVAAWVIRDGDQYTTEMVESVVERLTMRQLMEAHSEATIKLSSTLNDEMRGRWEEALKAVCEEIGDRFDRLNAQTEHLQQIQTLQRGGEDEW